MAAAFEGGGVFSIYVMNSAFRGQGKGGKAGRGGRTPVGRAEGFGGFPDAEESLGLDVAVHELDGGLLGGDGELERLGFLSGGY